MDYYLDTKKVHIIKVFPRGRDGQNNAKGGPAGEGGEPGLQIPTGITLTEI